MRRRKAESFNEDGVAAASEEPRHLGLKSRGSAVQNYAQPSESCTSPHRHHHAERKAANTSHSGNQHGLAMTKVLACTKVLGRRIHALKSDDQTRTH
jgi:hypothetical protein